MTCHMSAEQNIQTRIWISDLHGKNTSKREELDIKCEKLYWLLGRGSNLTTQKIKDI